MYKMTHAKAPPRHRPLAACLGSLFALSGSACAPPANAAAPGHAFDGTLLARSTAADRLPNVFSQARAAAGTARTTAPAMLAAAAVTNCGDDPNDFNNLRHAVLTANTGDTINLSGLPCSKITLQNGALAVPIDDLAIEGPGAGALTIDGNGADRVFLHTGVGTLALSGITVANGASSADKAYGGCIYTKGNLALTAATLTSCKALGQTAAVGGGAVAFGTISLTDSVLSGNLADAAIGGGAKNTSALGGAVVALSQTADTTVIHSIISGNTVSSPSGLAEAGGVVAMRLSAKYSTFTENKATGGGVQYNYSGAGAFITLYSLFMLNCTIDHNEADVAGGAVLANSGFATIAQSTISGNKAHLAVGGIDANVNLSMANSTIAFNTAGAFGGGGLVLGGSYNATLQSNIMADNVPSDLDGGMAISGSKNLIKVAGSNVTVPADTIALDPELGPLALNGGTTRTHAPADSSPAIDAGSNPASWQVDQRGGNFSRAVGAAADIGAVEYDPDRLFTDGFGG